MEIFNEFINLGIKEEIINALNKNEIYIPTPIQEQSIPLLLEGEDVIGQAQTGTGKTFAYSIPLLSKDIFDTKAVKALVLCPTRELSLQVSKEILKLADNMKNIRVATIYGGESYEKQFKALKQMPQIVIGTPGRIIDMMNKNKLSFKDVSYLVLDEADEMLKMGFEEDLSQILEFMPKERQTALFSATIPPFLKNVSKKYMNDAKMVKIENKTLTASLIEQKLYYVKKDNKKDLLLRLLDLYKFKSAMIFANTKSMVDELVLYLQELGFKADGIHGDLKQQVRDRVMQGYRLHSTEILIATDVAARGIDVDKVEAIINYDLPNELETYVHRIGRTARAGQSGMAISIASVRQKSLVEQLEKYIHTKIEVCPIPSVKDIETHSHKELYLTLLEGINQNHENHEFDNLLSKLAKESSDPYPLLVTLLQMVSNTKKRQYNEIPDPLVRQKREKSSKDSKSQKEKSKTSKKETNSKNEGFALIEVNIGQIDKAKPNQIVSYFHDEFKIHREHFGKITIDSKYSYIEVRPRALGFLKDFNKKTFNNHKLKINVIDKGKR